MFLKLTVFNHRNDKTHVKHVYVSLLILNVLICLLKTCPSPILSIQYNVNNNTLPQHHHIHHTLSVFKKEHSPKKKVWAFLVLSRNACTALPFQSRGDNPLPPPLFTPLGSSWVSERWNGILIKYLPLLMDSFEIWNLLSERTRFSQSREDLLRGR